MKSEHNNFNPSVSLIIPWRNIGQKDRNNIADWCFEYYKYLFPDAEILGVDSGDTIFSRGKSINKGVRECSGDYLIITDADYLFSKAMAKQIVNKQPWTVGVKKENYYYLNDKATHTIVLSENPKDFDYKNIDIKNNCSTCPYFVYGGLLALPKENFIMFDKEYKGYGYEDNTWHLCMNAFFGKEFRTDNQMFHLNHIRISGSEYMQKSYENKEYFDNVWKPLEGNRKGIRELTKEKGLLSIIKEFKGEDI